MVGGHAFNVFGGGAPNTRPDKLMATGGYWVDGIDFSSSDFSGAPLAFGQSQISTSASSGTGSLPAKPAGFIKVKISGQVMKMPYYGS